MRCKLLGGVIALVVIAFTGLAIKGKWSSEKGGPFEYYSAEFGFMGFKEVRRTLHEKITSDLNDINTLQALLEYAGRVGFTCTIHRKRDPRSFEFTNEGQYGGGCSYSFGLFGKYNEIKIVYVCDNDESITRLRYLWSNIIFGEF